MMHECVWMKLHSYLMLLIGLATVTSSVNAGQTYELCKDEKIRILNAGESGEIEMNGSSLVFSSNNSCILKIESCRTCQIEIKPIFVEDFKFYCMSGMRNNGILCSIACDYLYMFDMYYINKTVRTYHSWYQFYWNPFKSVSSTVFVAICHGYSHKYSFRMAYTVTKKFQLVTGSSSVSSRGFIQSPNFPLGYASNAETYMYHFVSVLQSDYIRITFDDWHLSSTAKLYFNKSNINQISGSNGRPVVISKANDMIFYFNTGSSLTAADNSKCYIGFRAVYQFLNVADLPKTAVPKTNCKDTNYMLEKTGGVIDFSPTSLNKELYDCVWVMKKYPGYDWMYLKIIQVKFNAHNSELFSRGDYQLRILGGLTSLGLQMFAIDQIDTVSSGAPFYHDDGFYVHLNATMTPMDKIIIAYASFIKDRDCPNMFMCDSSICIDNSLKCDGYDHCGDNSDETRGCSDNTIDFWNKSYQYTITVGVIVPVVISVFLIMVICLLFVMIRRCRRAQLQAQAANGSLSQSLGTQNEEVSGSRGQRRRHRHGMFGKVERDVPPSYNEAIQNPPGWFLDVAFDNPVDPNLPQPPAYNDIMGVDRVPTFESQLTPLSSESSCTEVTTLPHSPSASFYTSNADDTPYINVGDAGEVHSRRRRSLCDYDEEMRGLLERSVRNKDNKGSTSNSVSVLIEGCCYKEQLPEATDLEIVQKSDDLQEQAAMKRVEKQLNVNRDFVIPDEANVGEIEADNVILSEGVIV